MRARTLILGLLVIAAMVAALIVAPAGKAAGSSHWAAFDAIALELTGKNVDVRCATASDEEGGDTNSAWLAGPTLKATWAPSHIWGYAYPLGWPFGTTPTITLSRLVCASLLTALVYPKIDDIPYELWPGTPNPVLIGMSIHAITHELGHIVYGYTEKLERDAECFATSHDTTVARMFGLQGHWPGLMHRAGADFHSLLPPEYQEPCL